VDRARRLTGAMCGSVWATSLGPGAADGPRADSRSARRPSEVWVDAGVAPGWACHGSAGPGSASQGDVWGRRRGASGWRLVRSCAADERLLWTARVARPTPRTGARLGVTDVSVKRMMTTRRASLSHSPARYGRWQYRLPAICLSVYALFRYRRTKFIRKSYELPTNAVQMARPRPRPRSTSKSDGVSTTRPLHLAPPSAG